MSIALRDARQGQDGSRLDDNQAKAPFAGAGDLLDLTHGHVKKDLRGAEDGKNLDEVTP
jgi:hypothetical protein